MKARGHFCDLVVNRKHGVPFDVYVGRPTKWGNPFEIGLGRTRSQVIAEYEVWLLQQPELLAALPELRGKVLACWCAPNPCHADVLARLANDPQEINMPKTKNPVEALRRLAEKRGDDFRDDYSGRGMFSATCVGITTREPNNVIAEAGALGIKGAKTDGMGKSTIVYWPAITVDSEKK